MAGRAAQLKDSHKLLASRLTLQALLPRLPATRCRRAADAALRGAAAGSSLLPGCAPWACQKRSQVWAQQPIAAASAVRSIAAILHSATVAQASWPKQRGRGGGARCRAGHWLGGWCRAPRVAALTLGMQRFLELGAGCSVQ